MGKECCFRLSRRLWGGMKNELPRKRLRGRLDSQLLRLLNKSSPGLCLTRKVTGNQTASSSLSSSLLNSSSCSSQPHFNRHFHGFSTFDWDRLAKPVNTAGKNALKSVKLPSLKVICWKLITKNGWRAVRAPQHSHVCKISRLYGAISLLSLDVLPLNLVS